MLFEIGSCESREMSRHTWHHVLPGSELSYRLSELDMGTLRTITVVPDRECFCWHASGGG